MNLDFFFYIILFQCDRIISFPSAALLLFSENILYGILYRDGKAVYGLGQSYYPSFRPDKHPVPPEMDRIGEMRKDLNDLAESGFNLVRLAAVGSFRRESNGSIEVDFPFPDAICAEAEKYGLAAMVRLSRYSFHLPDSDGIVMQNEKGEDIPDYWVWFVRHCLNHPAVIKDECEGTARTISVLRKRWKCSESLFITEPWESRISIQRKFSRSRRVQPLRPDEHQSRVSFHGLFSFLLIKVWSR